MKMKRLWLNTMRTAHITTCALVLVTLLAVSCSKSPSEHPGQAENVRQSSSPPADMPTADLGEVELTASTPKRVSLAAGKECIIIPTVLADGSIQMDLPVESKAADGKIQRSGRSRLTQRAGQQCGITVGGMMVSLTPKLKTP
jgi:hypothetical protein